MSTFKKAETLREVAAQTIVEPLAPDDPRYVDLRGGRGTTDLRQMRIHLEDQNADDNQFGKVAFVGHRGSGKSTELLRLERDLADRFTSVHLYADQDLMGDFDYTDMLLWLAESLARKFAEDKTLAPLDKGLVDNVGRWFAERTLENVETVEKEITLEAEAEAGAYEKLLVPGQAYYPVLARIHQAKQGPLVTPAVTAESVETNRAFLRELLFNGAVLEYNGEECWYDVHPVIMEIQAFKDAFAALDKTAGAE